MAKVTAIGAVLLLLIVTLGVKSFVRMVQAEDDCAPYTWSVVRTGPVLWCIGEGWMKSELAFKGDRVRRRMH